MVASGCSSRGGVKEWLVAAPLLKTKVMPVHPDRAMNGSSGCREASWHWLQLCGESQGAVYPTKGAGQ